MANTKTTREQSDPTTYPTPMPARADTPAATTNPFGLPTVFGAGVGFLFGGPIGALVGGAIGTWLGSWHT